MKKQIILTIQENNSTITPHFKWLNPAFLLLLLTLEV